MSVHLNDRYLTNFISETEYELMQPKVTLAHNLLTNKNGAGSQFTGWLTLPTDYNKDEFERIKKTAKNIKNKCDIFIVVGIGGSYLGSRAVIELIKSRYYNSLNDKSSPDIYFAGNDISSSSLLNIIKICEDKDVCINVISKSGTTTEPAIAFNILKDMLENKYGPDEAKNRIFCTTDKNRGTLRYLSELNNYETFVIPDDIGGRYSVLTAVGLLPLAVANVDIDKIMEGAKTAQEDLVNNNLLKNDCYKYAAIRNILYNKGKLIELLVSYEPDFNIMAEWFKQLFSESEGKDGKGLFTASATFTTDLHSLGQYIQSGRRHLFETVIHFNQSQNDISVPEQNSYDNNNLNKLDFLSGKSMSFINEKAFQATVLAHTDGGVPNVVLEVPKIDELEIGYLIYFLEKACAISGYILGVNPFNQPGVENYKNNMFALLDRPGYESIKENLLKRLY